MSARCLLSTPQLHASSTPSFMDAGVAASAGATTAALQPPAIAHECRIGDGSLDVSEVFKRTPYIADLKPEGRFVAKDLFDGGASTADEVIAAQWFHAWRLHDRYRVCHGRKSELRGLESGPGHCPCGRSSVDHDRWGRRVAPEPRTRGGGRFSGATRGLSVGHLGPEPWQPRAMAFGSGYVCKYAQQVGPARHRAATHPGRAAEKACHADL